MQGKTHLAVGVAAAAAVLQPSTASGCLAALLCGAVGGVLCDVDTLRKEGKNDSIMVQLSAAAIAACVLAADYFMKLGLCASVLSLDRQRLFFALSVFAALWIVGFFSNHRGFTHSIAACALFTQAVWVLCPAISIPFAAAYASHIVLDLLNRKGVRLLFPMKGGVRFGLFYSDRTANDLFFWLGIFAGTFLLINKIALKLF